jgi:hypothetical protein
MTGLLPEGCESIDEALEWALEETYVAALQIRGGEKHWEAVGEDTKALMFHYSADAYQHRNRALRLWKRWRQQRDRTKKYMDSRKLLVKVANTVDTGVENATVVKVLLYLAHRFSWELEHIRTGIEHVDVSPHIGNITPDSFWEG